MLTRIIALICGVVWLCVAAGASARDIDIDVGGGVRIHAIDAGPPESTEPPLVFVPGWRFSSAIWRDQIAMFSKGRRVIAIDSRSQGASTKTTEGNTPEQRAIDLRALLDKLGVKRFVIVGWSQGVQDVAAYINRYGTSTIDRIVLVDSTVSAGAGSIVDRPGAASRTLGMLALLTETPRAYAEGMVRAVITRPLKREELDRLVDEAMRTPTAILVAMLVADLFGTDRTAAIGKMDRPTLIIASPRSAELDQQRAMAARISGAEFHVVEGAGHAVFVDRPEAFGRLLRDFIARPATSQPTGPVR